MVDVNAPPGLNREIVVAAAEAGKHILYEKGNLEAGHLQHANPRSGFPKNPLREVKRVHSFSRNFTHQEFDIDDFNVTMLFFADGMAVAEASWVSSSPFEQQLDLFGEDGFLSLRTGGTLTSIEASKGGPAVTAYLKDGASKEFPSSDVNGYCAEIEHFVSCVIDGGKPCLDPCDGRETLRVTLATLKSARTTRPVELNSSRGENLGAVKLERG
jgi:predicted dehydrogenase